MRAVAFYLPQYHPIPENDAIYGKNFTEWDNVRKAQPLFAGHYQPHVPHPIIGYYDLLDESFIEKQHELAWQFNVKNFCYYYYNMNGQTLLDKPLKIINRNQKIKNNFCMCWAHPKWYDNRDPKQRVFLDQVYSAQNAKAVIHDLFQYLENPRYMKIDGKPFLAVFAPERNPLMLEYAQIWREDADKMGLPGLHLAGVQAYTACNPALIGFDSMIEFAPHWDNQALLSAPDEKPRRMDYFEVVRLAILRNMPDFTVNRCVFPSWDNVARRGAEGMAAVNISPEVYSGYLDYMCEYTQEFLPQNLQYVFINAWNEWGEGCHLEPDLKYGLTYLEKTKDVLGKYCG